MSCIDSWDVETISIASVSSKETLLIWNDANIPALLLGVLMSIIQFIVKQYVPFIVALLK